MHNFLSAQFLKCTVTKMRGTFKRQAGKPFSKFWQQFRKKITAVLKIKSILHWTPF